MMSFSCLPGRWTVLLVALLALVLSGLAGGVCMAAEREAGATGGATTLVEEGTSRFVIYAPARVMEEKGKEVWGTGGYNLPTANVAKLRESVKDLAGTLEKISGAKVEILTGAPKAGEKRLPILIGELAVEKFGPVTKTFEFKQGFRYVVTAEAVGLMGESDLSTSYAIYELLYRLGCRMYMPGDLGWCVPTMKTVTLANADYAGHPYTFGRFVWYADAAYVRRNRIGGLPVNAGHALERYVTKEQRVEHPEWKGTVDGKVSEVRLKWSSPGVAEAIADAIIARAEKNPLELSYSLSPDDGMGYDNSAQDKALDAGDIDESIQEVSLSDRLVWLCNKVAKRVNEKHPKLMFGMLAYTPYSRPPVREKLDPNVIPQIAPITFSRAHPMDDDGEPNNKAVRFIGNGWAKAAPRTSYYFYSWFLAELSGPNPMIRKWSHDIPYIYKNGNCFFWQPETITNFESSFHAYALGYSMAWDPSRDPKQIIDELHEKFYGNAAKEMAEYWTFIDRVWYGVPEYSGCGFGHMRRWTTENLTTARALLEKGKAAAKTEDEKARILLADESLKLFEDFMAMRRSLADGDWAKLADRGEAYMARMKELGEVHQANYVFGKVRWSKTGSVNNSYFSGFYLRTYKDAARLANETKLVLEKPIRNFKFAADATKVGDAQKWFSPGFNDKAWKQTDVSTDTWSALGLHNYMGTGWYRTTVKVNALAADKKVLVWVGATDGTAEVWVNGKPAKFLDPAGKAAEFNGYCRPASFDATGLVVVGENQITIKSTRVFINELGTGGLLAPVTLYEVAELPVPVVAPVPAAAPAGATEGKAKKK